MRRPTICLVEPCHSHEEVLFPLIDYLWDDYDLHVCAPQSLLDVDIMSRTRHLYKAVPIPWRQSATRCSRLLQMPRKYQFIRKHVASINPEIVLFNSTHNIAELLMIAVMFRGIRKAQVVHDFSHYLRPGMMWLYDCFDVSLVISEDVYEYVSRHHPNYGKLDFFLPFSFKEFEDTLPNTGDEEANVGDVLHLGVIGAIDPNRRNYEGLLQSLAMWHAKGARQPRFMLSLIGKAPASFQKRIEQESLIKWVRCYDGFVSFREMFGILRKLDLVLFLIDDTTTERKRYNQYTVSCTSIWVRAFRKACASSREFPLERELRDKCIFYDGSHVEQLFEAIERGSVSRDTLKEIEARYSMDVSLFRREQKKRLVQALKPSSGQAARN